MHTKHFPIDSLSRCVTMLADALSVNSAVTRVERSAREDGAAAPRRRGVWAAMDDWFWRQQLRARDAYLAQSRDVFELEARMRELERNIGGRYY